MVSWKKATKNENRGSGVRKIREMNECLLVKWWWRYGVEDEALWKQVIICKYGSEGGTSYEWWRKHVNTME